MPRVVALALAAVLASAFQRQTFNTGVDLVAVDVTVVDKDGRPVEDVAITDFEVSISGAGAEGRDDRSAEIRRDAFESFHRAGRQ
jgi:protocatechuate 3,4-dioxygenase beta subunit